MSLAMFQISLVRQGVPWLEIASAEFPRGQLTTVLGRTLSGKTSLLRSLAGLLSPDRGEIFLDGVSLVKQPVWRRDAAMVYQQFINYPHLSVFDNVAFPLRRQGKDDEAVHKEVNSVLERVGLSGFGKRKPFQLSGGQQQRVALARALVRRCGLLLLDEPLVNLDYKLREQMREEFRGLFVGQDNAIIVYTTTEPAEALMLGHQVAVMHEGRILQIGSPASVYERPATIDVAQIVDDPPMNILSGSIAEGTIRFGQVLVLDIPSHLSALAPGNYKFGIRSRDLRVVSSGGVLGTLAFSEVSGSETFLYAKGALGELAVQIEGIHDMTVGSPIRVEPEPKRLLAFGADGALIVAP
ncbi:ABC transporter ATP-binding protein [Bradyrhizobium viridifuturi]|nr:ABC transporter ATP-binding protein [Bradyrhizobium viridifuturi]MBR1044990.1 ABC transporter ATP-binding protein [Bradyrhizobium viridifuturi]MBR1085803.1 ABC transporter ATP-binding protein [Bradyrhizobium viridifuturi]MBR1096342.1 ABC transporter ATP-binding protein [Bradyrhizobium viridifuturi]MBR1103424.1 ABC transporter ATP-binding protein [Bradyrhizobium viridifuturi]